VGYVYAFLTAEKLLPEHILSSGGLPVLTLFSILSDAEFIALYSVIVDVILSVVMSSALR
jgi:hypothetical protein